MSRNMVHERNHHHQHHHYHHHDHHDQHDYHDHHDYHHTTIIPWLIELLEPDDDEEDTEGEDEAEEDDAAGKDGSVHVNLRRRRKVERCNMKNQRHMVVCSVAMWTFEERIHMKRRYCCSLVKEDTTQKIETNQIDLIADVHLSLDSPQ